MIKLSDIYNSHLECPNILVLGDIIYDKYLFGNTTRLSAEAPVPIFQPCKDEFRLGGAANVFNNIISLGARAQLCGIIGNDREGEEIKSRLIKSNHSVDLIFRSSKRITIKKTRLLVGNHHLLRIDEENTSYYDDSMENKIFKAVKSNIENFDLLVISDYNKGFLNYSLIKKIMKLFIDRAKKIIVDSKNDFYKYSGAFLIKPNIYELNQFVGSNTYNDNDEMIYQCNAILDKGRFQNIYITMGEKGGILVGKEVGTHIIPAFGEVAVDITGAGDTVLAAIAVAIAANVDIIRAVNFASCVAGVSVSKFGTATVTKTEIASFIQNHAI